MANSSGSLGNVISRLAGLKSVSSRRVMPEAEFLQDLDDIDTDVSGTSQKLPDFANFNSPSENLPESDMGGQLTAQSYDVRANAATPPEEEKGLFSRFAESLTNLINQPKREPGKFVSEFSPKIPEEIPTEPVDKNGKRFISSISNQNPEENIPGAIPEALSSLKNYVGETPNLVRDIASNVLVPDVLKPAFDYAFPRVNPEPTQEQINKKSEEFNNSVQTAMASPFEYSAYGSANEVANHPALQAKFKKITGTNFEPQVAAQVSKYEEAMKGVEDLFNGQNTQLSEQAESIKQRILNNQSSESDNYYIGLALLMPLLIGGLFGKEAGLGALGGGAKGFADVLGNRQKSIREDEASLLDINKQQSSNQEKLANINIEKAKLPAAIRKDLPEDPNAHLVGMRDIKWQDPNTGMEERGVEIKPGLIARPEYVSSKEGKMDMLKAANELSTNKDFVMEINDLTNDVVDIVSQLKTEGEKNAFAKGFIALVEGKIPGSLDLLTQDITLNGKKVNAGIALREKLGLLTNTYGHAKDLGQADRAMQSHVKNIFENPATSLLSAEASINQMLDVRKLAQRGLVNSAANKGFYPQFVIQELESSNNPLFNKLNKTSNQERLNNFKKNALKSETDYAK